MSIGPSWSCKPMRQSLEDLDLLEEDIEAEEGGLDEREEGLVVVEVVVRSPTALDGTEGGASQSMNTPKLSGYVLARGSSTIHGSKGLSPPSIATRSP